jgi:RNA polymerase sigma factor (sigma-70 family)
MEVSALTHRGSVSGLRGPSPLLRLQSDERLIALTRRGQHAAFETLFSRYQSRLLSFCRHMLSSREDAEDVLQEVFAAAFNAVLADEREINVRPWLYRIARNRSLNHLRRASAVGVDSMDVHFSDNGLSTGDRVLRRESFRELVADVHELPETQRTALLLREIDALSYDQIAHAMETTVPSVKSLLVRARISLAEAAEARKLSCDEVRLELGEAAEGLSKLSPPARRHVRSCDRCRSFKAQLKENNHALAAIFPVGPLLLAKKLLLTKLGSTASAGGAHVAGGAGVGAGAGAGASVGAGAVAGAGAAGGSGLAGGMLTAGAGAIATKAVAGLAAAAIVTAGAVAADHAVVPAHHRHHIAVAQSGPTSAAIASYTAEPHVVREQPQPLSPAALTPAVAGAARRHRGARHHGKLAGKTKIAPAQPAAAAPTTATAPAIVPAAATTAPAAQPAQPTSPQPTGTQVTEVTTETTQLPAAATSATPPAQEVPPTTTTTPASPAAPVATPPTAGEPSTPASGEATPPAQTGEAGGPAASTPGQVTTTTGAEVPSAAGSEGSTGGTEVPTARIIHTFERSAEPQARPRDTPWVRIIRR